MGNFTVNVLESVDLQLLDEIGKLRVRTWARVIPEAAEMDKWLDEYDRDAIHFVIFASDQLVAAARLTIHSSIWSLPDRQSISIDTLSTLSTPVASFNRLVIAESGRGNGLATRLDAARMVEAGRRGCRTAVGVTPSGDYRIKQLESIGFRVVATTSGYAEGPFRYRPTTNEVVMICDIPIRSEYL